MLVGGIIFGILGDRLGRVVLLFGSILLYSVANIANGSSIPSRLTPSGVSSRASGWRANSAAASRSFPKFFSKEARGYGTMIVATVGVFGAVIGGLVAEVVHWHNAYFIGGGLGLILLVLRMSVAESGMFQQLQSELDASRARKFFRRCSPTGNVS